MIQYHCYVPSQGHRLAHDPIKAIIAPRPIGWISTIDGRGHANLAPYSFFNAVAASNPTILMFSSEGRKDTLRNIEETGEFVYNLATRPLANAMNQTSAPLPHEKSEFDASGLTPLASKVVRPPRVAESPVTMECKLLEIKPLVDLESKPLGNLLVLGQVVMVHIDKAYIKDGLYDTAGARPIARCGYRGDYAEVNEVFENVPPDVKEMPMDKAMFEKGLANRKRVVGAAYVEKAMANADDFDRPLQELVTAYCWGEIWGREGLSPRDRSILCLGMTVALNRPGEFKIHVKGALTNGLTREEIREFLLQSAIYCGVPAAIDAFRLAREAFADYDAAPHYERKQT